MSQFVWTFPGGRKTIAKDTAVAGNADVTKTVGTGKLWIPLNVKITLTTDATVANRICQVIIQDALNIHKFACQASAIAASLTVTKYFNKAFVSTSASYNALGDNLLEAGEDLIIHIISGVAGDAYDYLIEYLEVDTP